MYAKSLVAATLASLLIAAPVAHAQGVSRELKNSSNTEYAESSKKDKKKKDGAPAANQFPDATRQEPDDTSPSSKMRPKLNKIILQFQSEQFAEAIAGSDAILADPNATPYEKASAARFAAFSAAQSDDDHARAIAYLKQAIDLNALSNNDHLPLLLELAKMYNNDDKFDDAIVAAKRFLDEGKNADPIAHSIIGNAYYQQEKYAEAIAALKLAIGPDGTAPGNVIPMLIKSYIAAERLPEAVALVESFAAKAPDDKAAQLSLANLYAEAGQPEKSIAVFQRLRTAGKLTESRDYEQGIAILAKLKGKEADTQAFIKDGLDKGVLKPSVQLYGLLGQTFYNSDNLPAAIDAWAQGAPMAPNGDMYLNLAIVQNQAERYADAKASAHQALAKGVKSPGKAWMVIAESEQGLDNTVGIAAAYREAAKDPATRANAQQMLKKFGGQ
jgi:tetratricopeptide (TPR) repeat protein